MTELDTGEHTVQKTSGWIAPDGADPFNHELIGYHWNGREFRVPLFTQVAENLWQGGFVENLDLGDSFDVVVSLYKWGRYTGSHTLHEFEMYDGADVDVDTVSKASQAVLGALREGKRVLVHCQAGLNRSALVAANVLIENGAPPIEAIVHLRNSRSPEVLFNERFSQWLLRSR